MLGIIFLKENYSKINKLLNVSSVNVFEINKQTKGINICFNNFKNKKQETRFTDKVISKLIKNKINEVIIQNDIYTISEQLITKIKKSDIKIITGNNLYEKNLNNIITYILNNNKKILIEQMNLGILINKITYKRIEYIKQLSKMVKSMTIITQDKMKFENTCNNIFETEGLAIKLSDNFKNGLKNCTIIINFDILNKDIIDYVPNNCIFINFSDCIEKMKKSFKGIIVNDITVEIEKNNTLNKYIDSNSFRNLAIAQVILSENIDNKITHLIGIKGYIPISDIKKLDVNKRNKENKGKKNKR